MLIGIMQHVFCLVMCKCEALRWPTIMKKIKRLHANGPRVVKDGCGGLDQGAKGPEDRPWVVGTIGDIDE